ncbi:DUF4859 domain-containing protein [Bacteroides gallinaceum]|uniref:DUF4859 domain-containing protein n=1 Tax=Bacteroides gallinaceum TaxID=1462571 RepID=UPI0025A39C9E|nr:DUF4859 domain-containing protein [Bacteroides gallinaceum]MDM8153257.1 DUF4859 domain-containing protein [Bacteroides gallinaceum]
MKRNIFLALCCFACLSFTACSDDYADASSKHVYGENENPYMRVDIDAQMSVTAPLEVNGEHAYTVNLADYADKFEEKMGMSLDAVMSGLDNGTTVFYPINATRNQWVKTAYNAGTGWYFNSANQPCEANDEYCRAMVSLNQSARTLTVELTEGGIVAGTVLSLNVGFAVNGPDYDNYLRFTFEVSVTDPTVSVTSVNLPNTDYTAVDLMLTDVEANLTAVFNMSLEEFIAAFDAGTIRFYAANPSTGTWDTESAYTGEEPAGYWFDATGTVCAYPGTVCANFKPDSESVSESCVKVCCMPGLTAGDSYMCSFGFVDTTDSSKFFRYIVTCNIVE